MNNEINDSSVFKKGKEELGTLSYKEHAMQCHSVISK